MIRNLYSIWNLRTAAEAANSAANPTTPAEAAISTLEAEFQINTTKPYVLVVTLYIKDNIKF